MTTTASLTHDLLRDRIDHGDDVVGGEPIAGAAPGVDLAADAEGGSDGCTQHSFTAPRDAGDPACLDLRGTDVGLIAGISTGDGADAGQGRGHAAKVGDSTSELALDGIALRFGATRGKFPVVLG